MPGRRALLRGNVRPRYRHPDLRYIVLTLRTGPGRDRDLRRCALWGVVPDGQEAVQGGVYRHGGRLRRDLPGGNARLLRPVSVEPKRQRVWDDILRSVSGSGRGVAGHVRRDGLRFPVHDHVPPLRDGLCTRRRRARLWLRLHGLSDGAERHGAVPGWNLRARMPRGVSLVRWSLPQRFECRELRHLVQPLRGAGRRRYRDVFAGDVRGYLSDGQEAVPGRVRGSGRPVLGPVPGGNPRLRRNLRLQRRRELMRNRMHGLPEADGCGGFDVQRDELRFLVRSRVSPLWYRVCGGQRRESLRSRLHCLPRRPERSGGVPGWDLRTRVQDGASPLRGPLRQQRGFGDLRSHVVYGVPGPDGWQRNVRRARVRAFVSERHEALQRDVYPERERLRRHVLRGNAQLRRRVPVEHQHRVVRDALHGLCIARDEWRGDLRRDELRGDLQYGVSQLRRDVRVEQQHRIMWDIFVRGVSAAASERDGDLQRDDMRVHLQPGVLWHVVVHCLFCGSNL